MSSIWNIWRVISLLTSSDGTASAAAADGVIYWSQERFYISDALVLSNDFEYPCGAVK